LRVLVVNAGSSSLKLRVLDAAEALVAARDLPPPPDGGTPGLTAAVAALGPVDAVGHRVVHGGTDFRAPVRVDAGIVARLADLADLAPLHQHRALAALDAVTRALPAVPAVACFDTAFHADLPAGAATYALPREWRERWSLRRYGFHGLSHAYASRRAAALLDAAPERLRVVTCHLGAGASLAAVRDGVSVDTTMGFTPLEGLVMATRSGSVDPGLLLWLLQRAGVSIADLAHALEHDSGLLALAGTADMREVVAGAEVGEHAARLALEVYGHRLRAGIAAMAAAMHGLDAVVFTGGVGERAPTVRAAATAGLEFLGIELDADRNRTAEPDADVSARAADVRTLVVASREDLEIARQVRQILAAR
jgi:acetate kinase